MSGGSEAELKDVKELGWSALNLPQEIFLEEYDDFVRMGMAPYEIARAFGMTMDTLHHRLRRYGLM